MKKRYLMILLAYSIGAMTACGGSSQGQPEKPTASVQTEAEVLPEATRKGESEEQVQQEGEKQTVEEMPSANAPSEEDTVSVDLGKPIKSVAVQDRPVKSEYVIGEEFTVEGGTLLITYEDGTTAVVPMTAEGVKITPPGLSASGTKQVKIDVGSQKVRFAIKVVNKSYQVTFDENYEGAPEAQVESVNKGHSVAEKSVTREGYTLIGWYTNRDYQEKYQFDSIVTGDMTLYALWQKDGATYHTVTFDYGFYGARITSYSYPVLEGETIQEPKTKPERTGYAFDKWTTKDGAAFDFAATVAEDTTVLASWTKTVSGENDYVFEAEDTSLKGKTGPALSGDALETGMIVAIEDRNASNDRCVSYLYQEGNSLEFDFASDIEVNDAVIAISLSAEYRDYTYTPENFAIYLNGEELAYEPIVFTGVPAPDDNKVDCLPFAYYLVGENLTIQEGANRLQVMTMNSEPMVGTTLKAAAPMVDAVKITTSAVLTWDAQKNLPAANY
ncbi:MAG: InlB B-repeat-containing protein [Lachnospiraceae bacterium]|nr:InlB B-repeat-containing protein [Lachnospiraceae bacterium]